jgi:PAS domain S-box-containing protein
MGDGGFRLLLVEDNPGDARLVRELLRGVNGISIDAVDCLSAARARLSAPGIDIVLLDLGLPDSQGLETLARVRSHLPALPVIVLTGLDDEDLALEAVKAGAQDYLVKGRFDADSLLRAIRYATERKRAEAALRHGEERYRRLHESMTDCLVETRMSGEIQDVNLAYLAMLGYTREEALRLRYQDVTPARWHAFEQEIVETQIVPRGYSDVYQKEYIRKDGTVFPVELRTLLLRDGEGRPSGMWALIRDITERQRAEKQLRYQAALLANVNDAIVASDAQYRLTAWNMAAESLYGWQAEEVLGRNGLEIVSTEWPGAEADEMRRSIAEVGHWRGEATQARKDGTRMPVEVSTMVLRDESGEITGYASVNRDITGRKREEAERNEQLDELRRWQAVTLGRETRILDLKRAVNELLAQSGQPPRFPSAETDDPGREKE